MALYFPLAAFLLIAAAQTVVIPDLNATVPTHWNGAGEIDGWGPAWTFPVMTAAVGVGTIGVVGSLGLAGLSQNGRPARLRTMAATTVWTAGFLAAILGLAGVGGEPGPMLMVSMLGGAVVGALLAWWAFRVTFDVAAETAAGTPGSALGSSPAPHTSGTDDTTVATASPRKPATDEHRSWTGTASMGTAGKWVTGSAMLALMLVVVCGVIVELRDTGSLGTLAWLGLPAAAIVLVLFSVTLSARVTVDETGLTVRGSAGWPRVHVPAERVDVAGTGDVSALGEFGGWGWRYFPGSGAGAVFRSGDALRVVRTNGSRFTVTVDDAATAAALLNAYADRAKRMTA